MLFKSRKTKQKFNPDYWRDHSANERTYLSWMRASIALMGFGLVILRLRTASST
ncbi:YidH family protein, partial [Microcystis aeruginosa]